MVRIDKQLFKGKQNIKWNEVEKYLKRYIGKEIIIAKYGDKIIIDKGFPDEFKSSKYTQRLRGAQAKVKANAAQIIAELVENATNKRYVPNLDEKHHKDASKGWYRYDVFFEMCVKSEKEEEIRWNCYRGTIVVRENEKGKFLYDLINIKKEARKPL